MADPLQLTGRRIRLSAVNCFEAPSTCDEISLLNGLDGWSVNPRMTLAFTGRVSLASIDRTSAFVLRLGDDAAEPVSLSRLVWDPEGRTLYAKPERVLRQGRPHALVVTSRVRDDEGRPLRPAKGPRAVLDARLVARLGALGLAPGEIVAVSVFTTGSVTARPARFAPPAPFALAAVPPSEVAAIAFGAFDSASFLTGSRHVPRRPSSKAPDILGAERLQAVVFLLGGARPAAGWPVVVFGHGFGNDKNLITPLVAGTFARRGGVVLGSALGGLVVGLGGYTALAVAIAIGGVTAALLAAPLARTRRG